MSSLEEFRHNWVVNLFSSFVMSALFSLIHCVITGEGVVVFTVFSVIGTPILFLVGAESASIADKIGNDKKEKILADRRKADIELAIFEIRDNIRAMNNEG